MQHFVIFFVSLFCILLELFLTRILNLKAWNHVVYIVIPFAMLGYGIGANLQLLFPNQKRDEISFIRNCGILLILISLLTLFTILIICPLPIKVEHLLTIFTSIKSLGHLLLAYTVFMLPFIAIGYLVVYIFSAFPQDSNRLYFYDLLGAGLGAFLFYPLINSIAVFPSLFLFIMIGVVFGVALIIAKNSRMIMIAGLIVSGILTCVLANHHDPVRYNVDDRKGWECIPGYFSKDAYRELLYKWHPLGRTNLYEITDPKIQSELISNIPVTFDINLSPRPSFAYFSTNFLAGTPVYHFDKIGMAEHQSKVHLFSQAIEAPYLFLKNPSVLIIGAGGGRDIFMAHTHGAQQILGAEINPGVYGGMAKGGVVYDYSNRIYDSPNTHVYNLDGRYLVKKVPPQSQDLIILNGVDTFSGLSSGAYAYAESYLYTKDAIVDYLKSLKPDGMINFNRWLFVNMPRETLRLFVIALDALRDMGVQSPSDHIAVGAYNGWSILMIKKSPFNLEQIKELNDYFAQHGAELIYPTTFNSAVLKKPLGYFQGYVDYFHKGWGKLFIDAYRYDISVVTDDNPFFYKYYKIEDFSLFKAFMGHHDGTIVFLTQFLILGQAIFFIALFIFIPLFIFKYHSFKMLPQLATGSFITYFSCLGAGFMFLEIPLMQKFVLLLSSPIYSISVVLASLLISTGLGSYLMSYFRKYFSKTESMISFIAFAVFLYVLLMIWISPLIRDTFLATSFIVRCIIVSLVVFPLGIMLGTFFPMGLKLVATKHDAAIPWAWGINSGFSVLAGILAIIIGQFWGFNAILLLGACCYLIAINAFRKLNSVL